MNRRTLFASAVFGMVLSSGTAPAQQSVATSTPVPAGIRVEARAARTDVTVGEPFEVEVRAEGPDGTVWTFLPEAGDDKVELRTPPPPAPGAPAPPPLPPGVHRYEASVFGIENVAIPPISVHYRLADGTEGDVATESIELRIASVLPSDPKEQKLVDVRPPLSLSIGPAFWIALGIAVLLVAALLYRLTRKKATVIVPRAEPETPADVEARAALDRLERSGLMQATELRPYYIELAVIGKRYLERRLGAPIVEMTSHETVTFLREHPVAHELASPVRDMVGAADRIKFAKGIGVDEEARRHLAAARQMIIRLESLLAPKPAPGASKGGAA